MTLSFIQSFERAMADAKDPWVVYTAYGKLAPDRIKSKEHTRDQIEQVFVDMAGYFEDPKYPGERITAHPDIANVIAHATNAEEPQKTNGGIVHNGMEMTAVLASDIRPRATAWLWDGHLPQGMIELLTGLPDVGKSQLQCDFVACVTTGRDWPDGARSCAPSNVIMLAAEDVIEMTLVPRLIAAGADMKRVKFVTEIKPIKHPELGRTFMLTPSDIALLEKLIKEWDAKLVTIDPITAYFSAKGGDQHKAGDVRSQIGPLKGVAERTNACISCVTHPAKNSSQRALDQFIGSQAFIALARVGHLATAEYDPESNEPTGRKLFAQPKNNVHAKMPTLAFRQEQLIVDTDKDTEVPITASHVIWCGKVDLSADQALAGGRKGNASAPQKREARTFLKELLEGGPVDVKEIREAAKGHGLSWPTVERAKAELNIRARRVGSGKTGKWTWELASADVIHLATRDGERVDRDIPDVDDIPEAGPNEPLD
jgi:putative DNA primase/helicase